MALITKIPGVTFTDNTLPKLYRESVITAGTRFLFDADDTYSYPSQATPVPGTTTWRDLSPVGATASFGSATPFEVNGFNMSTAVDQAKGIQLPASGKFTANPASGGFLVTYWFKYLSVSASSYASFMGLADTTSLGANQYSVDNGAPSSNKIRVSVDSYLNQFDGVVGGIYQVAMAAKLLGNGTYKLMTFVNGTLLGTSSPGRTVLGQATGANPIIGGSGGFAAGTNQKALRCWYDNTSTLADQAAITALVLKDYTDNVSRFT